MWDVEITCSRLVKKLILQDNAVDFCLADPNSISNYSEALLRKIKEYNPDTIIAQSTGALALTSNLIFESLDIPKIILISPLGFLKNQMLIKPLFLAKRALYGIDYIQKVDKNKQLPLRWLDDLFSLQENLRGLKINNNCTLITANQDITINNNKTLKFYSSIFREIKHLELESTHNIIKTNTDLLVKVLEP